MTGGAYLCHVSIWSSYARSKGQIFAKSVVFINLQVHKQKLLAVAKRNIQQRDSRAAMSRMTRSFGIMIE